MTKPHMLYYIHERKQYRHSALTQQLECSLEDPVVQAPLRSYFVRSDTPGKIF